LGGHPLVAWAIAAARQTPDIDRIVVSSDSVEILAVAERYGAEALARPPLYAGDGARDSGVLHHARERLAWPAGRPIVYLRPTTPLRDPAVLGAAIRYFARTPRASALRSVQLAPESPLKWYHSDEDGWLVPVNPQLVNAPRQACPPAWIPNGYIDILRGTVYADGGTLGFAVVGDEIDSPRQLAYLQWVVSHTPSPLIGVLDACERRVAVAS